MKFILPLCVLLATSLQAQTPSASPATRTIDYPVNAADIRAIEFETDTATLLFTVKGQRFSYRLDAADNPAAVLAGFATLTELRRATTVTLRAWPNELGDPPWTYSVDRITFHYDTLKP